jgi:hypothetical protein
MTIAESQQLDRIELKLNIIVGTLFDDQTPDSPGEGLLARVEKKLETITYDLQQIKTSQRASQKRERKQIKRKKST